MKMPAHPSSPISNRDSGAPVLSIISVDSGTVSIGSIDLNESVAEARRWRGEQETAASNSAVREQEHGRYTFDSALSSATPVSQVSVAESEPKIDIFARLRGFHKNNKSVVNTWSTLTSSSPSIRAEHTPSPCASNGRLAQTPQGHCNPKAREALLYQNYGKFMENLLAEPQPRHLENEIQDGLGLIQAYHESVSDASLTTRDPVRAAEVDILDAERYQQLEAIHHQAIRPIYEKRRARIKQKMTQAEAAGDLAKIRELRGEKEKLIDWVQNSHDKELLANLKARQDDQHQQHNSELETLDELRQAQILLALPADKTALQLVEEAEAAREALIAQFDDQLEAIDDCHLEAVTGLLDAGLHASRKSTTRVKRLQGADVDNPRERKEIVKKRLQHPSAANFIGRATMELGDAETTAELVESTLDKIAAPLEQLKIGFSELHGKQELALLKVAQLGPLGQAFEGKKRAETINTDSKVAADEEHVPSRDFEHRSRRLKELMRRTRCIGSSLEK